MRNGIKKIIKSRNTGTQVRLDSFFKVTSTGTTTPNKRKVSLFELNSRALVFLN